MQKDNLQVINPLVLIIYCDEHSLDNLMKKPMKRITFLSLPVWAIDTLHGVRRRQASLIPAHAHTFCAGYVNILTGNNV